MAIKADNAIEFAKAIRAEIDRVGNKICEENPEESFVNLTMNGLVSACASFITKLALENNYSPDRLMCRFASQVLKHVRLNPDLDKLIDGDPDECVS